MKFLADECLDGRLVARLRAEGCDVVTVRDRCPGARDPDVLALARSEGRILLTEDKDFGELALRAAAGAPGVILFRDLGTSVEESWAALRSLLARHGEALRHGFAVIRGRRIRLRSIDQGR